jgi:hypothetical protein
MKKPLSFSQGEGIGRETDLRRLPLELDNEGKDQINNNTTERERNFRRTAGLPSEAEELLHAKSLKDEPDRAKVSWRAS